MADARGEDGAAAPSEEKLPESQDSSPEEGLDPSAGEPEMECLRNLLMRTGLQDPPAQKVLDECSLSGVAKYILSGKCNRIICIVGAGISTSAGIPDFRSPGTGIYDNLKQYELPYPEAIFEIDYFKKHPKPFFELAKELFPSQLKPTICHYFIRMLRDKKLLLRCYTQNIDTLERVVGLSDRHLIEAHGTFYRSHCVNKLCMKKYDFDWMKDKIFTQTIPFCQNCYSLVKPDIVFFGEGLPEKFFEAMQMDFPSCDLLMIMGTSLQVQPFASLVNRDVAYIGLCDDGCLDLAELLGWKEELEKIVLAEHTKIDQAALRPHRKSSVGKRVSQRVGRSASSSSSETQD
ncbi:NAD-dependent protein deacetylase sirtuin-2 isoform X2 [Callorhinchus milii]|uniref:NAD-dependent protein deacetylase sirtuin-2 isoform X2 n=1 Tax=Callorhinchus milii TaxID=7868 RepID=UPI001C3F6604|nr:NAD-dependent protein deacetylase sirtuin-2 isoform X2 [Callorhinchus milii]